MERGLASLANPILPKTPTTERNVSLRILSRRLAPRAPPEASALVLLAPPALRRVQLVPDRHQMTVLPVLLDHTSSTGAALALTGTAFVLVLI